MGAAARPFWLLPPVQHKVVILVLGPGLNSCLILCAVICITNAQKTLMTQVFGSQKQQRKNPKTSPTGISFTMKICIFFFLVPGQSKLILRLAYKLYILPFLVTSVLIFKVSFTILQISPDRAVCRDLYVWVTTLYFTSNYPIASPRLIDSHHANPISN